METKMIYMSPKHVYAMSTDADLTRLFRLESHYIITSTRSELESVFLPESCGYTEDFYYGEVFNSIDILNGMQDRGVSRVIMVVASDRNESNNSSYTTYAIDTNKIKNKDKTIMFKYNNKLLSFPVDSVWNIYDYGYGNRGNER